MRRYHTKPIFLLCAITLIGCGKAPLEDEEPTASTESELSLPGSKFEIDPDANLIDDLDDPGTLDWVNVPFTKQDDKPTGQTDDSYGGGAKEDDPCPPVGTGSIPNNKSDLKAFGVYQERGSTPGDPGYLHVFWTRVQDPTGTTLMDFEFNQSKTVCSNGVNPQRTDGDILLEYRIAQGGATATLKLRTWIGAAWGTAQDLTSQLAAVGDINESPIAGDSANLGALGPHTFGEASIDLDFVFSPGRCKSFGSAFVKSRASDAFGSQLKDFIAPRSVDISNCGQVVIRKETDPKGLSGPFDFSHTLKTASSTSTTFSLEDGQSKTFDDVLIGNGYTVTEAAAGSTHLASINCSASVGVTPVVDLAGRKVTFGIDDPFDVVDCTFTNRARGAIRIAKTRKHAALGSGLFPHAGVSFTISGGSLSSPITVTTDANGNACADNLILGNYTVTEQVPAGYVAQDAATKSVSLTTPSTCSSATPLSFVNLPLTNITVAVDSIVPGGTASTINCTGSPEVKTGPDGDGTASFNNLRPGTYTCTIVVDP